MSDETWRNERLECPCGHPLHPADGGGEWITGGAYWLVTTVPVECPKCGKASVVRLTEDAHAWAGYVILHECRCDPAGEDVCPSAWPSCLACDEQVDPASSNAPFCTTGCDADDLRDAAHG